MITFLGWMLAAFLSIPYLGLAVYFWQLYNGNRAHYYRNDSYDMTDQAPDLVDPEDLAL